MSLLPEKPLTFSPQLAATLGLEEAVLLQALIEIAHHRQSENPAASHWVEASSSYLASLLPFWQAAHIFQLAENLQQKGVIHIHHSQAGNAGSLKFSLDHSQPSASPSPAPSASTAASSPSGSHRITQDWQPEPDVVAQLNQYGIPHQFIQNILPEFITYWGERGEPHYSWGSKFLKHCLRLWREQQDRDAKQLRESAMHSSWRPSRDAMEILTRQAGINSNFIEDAIPEFILYWSERGNSSSTWNSRFVQHVRRQWLKYNATIEHDSDPHVMRPDWLPTEDLYEVLKLANIPREFAEQEIPAFVLYWRETGRAENSWNTKFLQYIKKRWSSSQPASTLPAAMQANNDHGKRQSSAQPVSTRNRSIVEDLTDRSWAN